jgi:hypothetical protein
LIGAAEIDAALLLLFS